MGWGPNVGWRSTAALALSGVFGSSSALTQELVESDTVLRAPLALSRRIGFVQLRGGSGASSTAAYVASLLAHRRSGMVLGVNVSAGERQLLSQTGLNGTARPRDAERRERARTAKDARAGLPLTASGLYGLDLTRDGVAAPAGDWFQAVTPIARFYDVVCTDWGVRQPQLDLRQVAAASHVVCLVARADRHAAEEAAAVAPALADTENRPRVVLALVDVGHTGTRTARLLAAQLEVPVLSLPYEAQQSGVPPVTSRRLPARTRLAHTRLATVLMAEATRTNLDRRPAPAGGGGR